MKSTFNICMLYINADMIYKLEEERYIVAISYKDIQAIRHKLEE